MKRLIVRKDSAYRQAEFARRKSVDLGGVRTGMVSREDLILSKLLWARDAKSELQMRDVPHFPHISDGICGNFPPGDLSGRATGAR